MLRARISEREGHGLAVAADYNGKTLTARHERSDNGRHWMLSMTVTISKVD